MGAPLPSSLAAPVAQVDSRQHFVERRRERFTASFPSQCNEIRELINRADRRERRAVQQLRTLTHRLGTLARIAGFATVVECVRELQQVISDGRARSFDAVLAREVVEGLHDAFATDLASLNLSAPPIGAVESAPIGAAATDPVALAPPRILIVDDHALIRGGLRALLADGFGGASFADATDGAEALEQLRSRAFDLALLDISLPGRNGLDLLKDLKDEWPQLPVLVLTGHREDELAMRALKAGASGYLTKESAADELVKAVRKILGGGRYVSEALAEQLAAEIGADVARRPHETLSDREYDVMCRIASGKTVSEIADEMSLSVKTISTYRIRILQKIHVRNNAEIAQYALRNGLVC